MAEKLTPQELDQMMDRMFTIDPKDISFFRKQFAELIKTEEGSNLLRSLNSNFNGKKMNLVTYAKPGGFAHCFDDESEIGIGVSSLLDYYLPHKFPITIEREVTHGYPKLLFHELTHWEQYQNQGASENAITDQDRYFTAIMCEADAQISGDLFKMKLEASSFLDKGIFNPAWQMAKLAGMIATNIKLKSQKKFLAKTQRELQENHPEWTGEQIEKETRKAFFKKSILDRNSGWRRFYDNPENRKKLGILNDDPSFPKKEFPELMRYYMDKYGLTLEECLDLKKEILAQSDQKFSTQEVQLNRSNGRDNPTPIPHQTNAEMLARTSHQTEKKQNVLANSPKTDSKKLNPSILSHLTRGGQGE
ncbi:MAG: hypothetical protein IKS41_01605 [Alphaproteobacteria bacterium]|nr:hypothetical protein [Alphaproteobacteria bacterium]